MKKKPIIYSDLTKKQLENLKELYVQKKIESMSHQELEEYVQDIISHQVNDTIDKEEEMEAWREMSDFFGEQFEIIIQEIQIKYIDDKNVLETEIDSQKQRIEFLEKEIYPKEKGYVRGVLAPTFTSKMENSPTPLPEAVRGDALTISEISIGELKSAENWPMEFGDIFPIQHDVNDNYLVPGLRLFSKDSSLALSAWFSCLEPIKLVVNKNQLILEASEDDKWLVTDLPEKDANILNTKFLENKKNSFGYQFISIQSTPYIEKFAGFWILRDIELIS